VAESNDTQGKAAAPRAGWLERWVRGPGAGGRRLNLALQGGGAHGAFTWGVLDALLDDTTLEFEGLSGSSAGAMNAVVFADGWLKGGREGARAGLARFWTELGSQMPWALLARRQGDSVSLLPGGKLVAQWARYFSPAQWNPLDLNPLRDLLEAQLDLDRLRTHSPFKLFIGTTQVNTGKLRIFREHELSVDVLLASACLPRIHRTVMLDGEPYWDGGFAANPAVSPLFYDCEVRDILLVLLNPLRREDTPVSAPEIETRSAELAFSANFMREMRTFANAIEFAGRGGAAGALERRLLDLRFHMVDASKIEGLLRSDTKLVAHSDFLRLLHDQGRERAAAWLQEHGTNVGRRSSIDVGALFG